MLDKNKADADVDAQCAQERKIVNEQERRWLEDDAISAATGGPVEDQEGVPNSRRLVR